MSDEKNNFIEGVDYPAQKASDDSFVCDDEVTVAAQKAFGITYLFPWQRIVIANILDSALLNEETDDDAVCKGKQIVLLPTGAGKSLCFLTPALILDGPTLVLYPLLALMTDQKRRMDEGNLQSVTFRGGQSLEEREENFVKIKNGAKIILANPEVLQNEELVQRLSQCNIKHIAIDEAHCVSEWGDSFRPAYLELGKIIKKLGVKTVTAFTATASPEVLDRVSQVLFENEAHIVRSDSDRPNIHYEVINCYSKKRKAFLLALERPKPLIIFCGTRSKSEDMARELAAYYGKDKVRFYHAGLTKEEKETTEKWFYPKTDAILCCTCAFGMGIDKKNIKTVIHLEPSPTAESYIQEAGRGGRDGSIADAVLLWSYEDSIKARKFKENSRERVLSRFAESSTCRRQILLDALGGEQAACDGCDVCNRKGPAPKAEDAKKVFNFIRLFANVYTKEQINYLLIKKFNRETILKTKISVWENSDIDSIISQLFMEKKIQRGKILWRKKLRPVTKIELYINKKLQVMFKKK